jgi:hypothetical protein
MFKTLLSALAASLLVHSLICAQPALASTTPEKQSKFTEKVRNGIAKLGTGPDARVAVKLKDKTKLAGYISEISDDSFVIAAAGTGEDRSVAYGDVSQVRGHNLSTGGKIAIALGIAAAVLLILLIFENYG